MSSQYLRHGPLDTAVIKSRYHSPAIPHLSWHIPDSTTSSTFTPATVIFLLLSGFLLVPLVLVPAFDGFPHLMMLST